MGSSLIRVLTILIILTVSFLGSGQNVFNKAFDVNNAPNFSSDVVEIETGYIFTQRADYNGFSHIQAIKLDTLGNITDSNTLVQSDTALFYGFSGSLQKLSTPEFCQLYKVGPDSVIRLVFFDVNLQKIRTKKYYFNQFTGRGVIKQVNDSTLLILCQVSNPSTWDLVLMNTDLQGNERWRTIFGEPGKDDYGFTIEEIDGEIVVGGQTYFSSQVAHPHIISFNKVGQIVFDTIYTQFDNGGSFAYHSDYGFFLYSSKNNLPTSLYPTIIKLDSNFIMEWSQEYFRDAQLVAVGAITISDQGIISMAGSQIFGSNNSGVFFQINHQGDSLGSKILEHIPGSKASFDNIRPTSDGGYILAGQTKAPTQDSWIVKVNAWGCDNIPCVVSVDEKEVSKGGLNCYPNPTNGAGTISGYLSSLHEESEVKVYNSIGQLIQTISITQKDFEFPVNLTQNGLYFVVLMQNGEIIKQQKWVVH